MGNTIWVEVRGRPVIETASDSTIIYKLIDNLDALAGRLRVTKPSTFLDYTELERAFAEFMPDADDEGELSLEEKQSRGNWHEAAVGLAAMSALRKHLTDHFEDLGFTPDHPKRNWPRQLMEELTHTVNVLEQAAGHGQQFRLMIVP